MAHFQTLELVRQVIKMEWPNQWINDCSQPDRIRKYPINSKSLDTEVRNGFTAVFTTLVQAQQAKKRGQDKRINHSSTQDIFRKHDLMILLDVSLAFLNKKYT